MPIQEVARAAHPSVLLQGAARRRNPVLLDGGGPESWGDGGVIYADDPSATLVVFPSGWGCCTDRGARMWRWADPLTQWEAFIAAGRAARGDALGGGFVTVLSYDLKHWIEALPRRLPWPRQPVLYCARYDWSYRANYRSDAAHIAAADAGQLTERLGWYEEVLGCPAEQARRARRPSPLTVACPSAPASPSNSRRRRRAALQGSHKGSYETMIARAHEYIAAGDIYEVNLAQRFTAAAALDDGPALFAAWSHRYPMPFAAYVDGGDWAVVSNSPECFLACNGRDVSTYPIKGTRRRDPGSAAARLAAELRSDAKERAEHVMVVDLERNDLGRVCEIGSVEVADFAAVRQYPVLVHMVSHVRGRLRPETSLAELLRAVFPGGSITGAPKIRAMQIIEELEPAARGLYTGAIGWTDLDGRSRFSIAIRTAVLDAGGLTYWAGGGIVADSDAHREYAETLLKSETLFRALDALERRSA